MPVIVSSLFDFIQERSSGIIERYEIGSTAFSDVRRRIRSMIFLFHESDDPEAREIAYRLRSVISKWLTVPVRFDNEISLVLKDMGNPDEVGLRWGRDISSLHKDACLASNQLEELENPLRTELVRIITALHEDRRTFRVYCHRRSREHFESVMESSGVIPIPQGAFIHSVSEYNRTQIFDVLVKVGPLRSRGWGAVPDAILTAPRFKTIFQLVWSGCSDEPAFGYDPVSAQSSIETSSQDEGRSATYNNPVLRTGWELRETRSMDAAVGSYDDIPDVNDLEVFTRLAQPTDLQRATLIQIDEDYGILYPPLSRVLSLDNDPATVGYRLPGETLQAGMFLIIPVVDNMHLTGLQAEEGYFSHLWKKKLLEEFQSDPEGLIKCLRDAGLALLGLRSCVWRWCIPATTVIPAPRQIDHFEILIRVLGIDFDAGDSPIKQRAAWWQYAWDEIRRSRGEAIQMGFHEHQILEDQVMSAVKSLEDEVRDNLNKAGFRLPIDANGKHELKGELQFYKILALEEGFRVPSGELKLFCELDRIDQWRE